VTNEVSGLLVDPENPEAWRDAVTDMLARPEIARARGKALRDAYEKEFSLNACVLAEHALYEELTGKPVRR
jgi:glycosyltransferase involved in cell wall biosynthesis